MKSIPRNTKILLALLVFFMGVQLGWAKKRVVLRIYDGDHMSYVKAHPDKYRAALDQLKNDAKKSLKFRPVSVMDKDVIAVSGDKHDYISMGPYWWPDPTKPDGLPYIRKDGVRNPNATADRQNIGKTINNMLTLGVAYYFFGDEAYAKKAAEIARTWFINPATRMNPNMNYAQMIPGRNGGKGRGNGMIDIYSFVELTDVLQILQSSTSFTKNDMKGMKQWFTEFLNWMATSPVADEERRAANNHGLAFDVQTADYALFVGDETTAKDILDHFASKRLFKQIEPDGRQPLELARTNGFSYTVFNIIHMIDMCYLAKTLGIDFYHMQSADGRSIPKALKYMVQFLGTQRSDFPYQQIKDWTADQNNACWQLIRASRLDSKSDWAAIAEKHITSKPTDRRYLLYGASHYCPVKVD